MLQSCSETSIQWNLRCDLRGHASEAKIQRIAELPQNCTEWSRLFSATNCNLLSLQMELMFNVKDQNLVEIMDFDVFINGVEVTLKDDKKTTQDSYQYGSKLTYIVKKRGYVVSDEIEHTVLDTQPNEIMTVLDRQEKVRQ